MSSLNARPRFPFDPKEETWRLTSQRAAFDVVDGSRTMTSVATLGLDIAKSFFQVHGVDTAGQVVVRQRQYKTFAYLK